MEGAIVGHSERRQHFGETDETVRMRCEAALAAGLAVIAASERPRPSARRGRPTPCFAARWRRYRVTTRS